MLRITGGELRGRLIKAPKTDKVRPTQSRLRQALFNSLQTVIADSEVLDLFAGSGALGFEAISWGAARVTFVEEARVALRMIEENAQGLQVRERTRIWGDSVERLAQRIKPGELFDLVLADPPYDKGWEMKLLQELPWERILKPLGLLCLEWGVQKSQVERLPEATPFLVKIREKNYGDSVLTTYQMQGTST